MRSALRAVSQPVAIVAVAATATMPSQISGDCSGHTVSVRATLNATRPARPAAVPSTTPVTASSSPSVRTMPSTCRGVAPASRCLPNSRLRNEVAAYRLLISMMQAKPTMMPTTIVFSVSTFLSPTDLARPAASIASPSIAWMYSVAVATPMNSTSGISTPASCAARCRVLSTAR